MPRVLPLLELGRLRVRVRVRVRVRARVRVRVRVRIRVRIRVRVRVVGRELCLSLVSWYAAMRRCS